jgi:threonine dehydratase
MLVVRWLRRCDLMEAHDVPTKGDIEAAVSRIAPHARRTPVMTSSTFDGLVGAKLFFKCENFQRAGAFKFRGACNAVFSLSDSEASKGVVTHSSGNHAQALALAARLRGIPCRVVMPANSAKVKVEATKGYGAQTIFCKPTQRSREEALGKVLVQTGGAFVHPYDDARVIAGQATACRELVEEVPGLDMVVAPVGGGGLVSGTSLAARFWSPGTKVYGVEPEGAGDACRSLKSGTLVTEQEPKTIADGLLTCLSPLTFSIIRENVADIVTVDDEAVIRAMKLVFERMKMVVEPSAAVPIAALLEGRLDVRGKRVGVIVSGGNVDAAALKALL